MGLVVRPDGTSVSTTPTPYVQVRETMSLIQRQVEDLRWDNLSVDERDIDLTYGDRAQEIRLARRLVKRNPLAITAVGLLKHYVLGQGISVKASDREVVARVVDEFINNPVNRLVLTSLPAQQEFLETLWTDGDFFVVLFVDEHTGEVTLGYLDALFVEDVINDPENSKVAWFYKVRKPKRTFNWSNDTWEEHATSGEYVYYRDWKYEGGAPAGMGAKLQKGLVYQISKDRRGKFGRSEFGSPAQDWARAHREFMEDRATLNRAAASVAWRKKRTGPASDVAAEAERLRSSLVAQPGRYEVNPPKATGSTVVENSGTKLEWVDTNTGGAAADFDERKLRMMAGAAMGGIPNHYFGDEGSANLATATAMELPLLKKYEAAQAIVRATMLDLIDFMLQAAHDKRRIPERDEGTKYSKRDTTAQAVMDQPEADHTGPAKARMVGTREAIQLPYAPPPMPGGVRLIPKPEDASEDPPEKKDTVSWYVDIDFPPIVQKQVDLFMNALTALNAMLPSENIESKKFVVEQAMTAFGVNDIDAEMTRIFPPDMVAILAPPPPPPQLGPDGKPLPPAIGQPAPVAESIASYRRRRLLRAVGDATEVLEEVETA